MCIFHEYIQHAYQAATGHTPDYDEIYWQLTEENPYVNTRSLFRKTELTETMEHMLAGLDASESAIERSRHILSCWIHATDWLATHTGYVDHVPRVHPQISGRTDQLLRPDILPLYELDEETFREATGQLEAPADRYITQELFRHSERYWFRFMDWLERALRDTSDRCCRQLAEFVRRCSFDERQIRRWKSSYGEIRVYMEQQPVDEIDIMEFDTDFLTGYVDSVARGIFVPVIFHATVHYRNGSLLARFSGDADVNDLKRPGASDFCAVVDDAIEWIRQEIDGIRELTEPHEAAISEDLPERQLAA